MNINEFEKWWVEIGQYDCAPGQPDHKLVIRTAYKAGAMNSKITSQQFVDYWQNLDFKQLCTLTAQSLLRAAEKVDRK